MENGYRRCAIFCTADIPPSTIERFLEAVVKHEGESKHCFSRKRMNTAKELALITTEDLSTIHRGLSSPVGPFNVSPFIGMSVGKVTSGFIANIQEPRCMDT
ncbi:hypothetical protein D9619_006021 [Psilocybe cf. subviscida]|uniref:Uncharacterized protein n=1 Tax=Psilocybe cf. subviscida TaxID=2480587 RepID=A0A8H5FBC2_9AGAR|nr:hypothetical protein D9619_006021 [Psilocybe cf. subviscida]